MKLKYDFVMNNIAGESVAVPVGEGSENFKGYIRLNDTAAYIFTALLENKTDIEEIVDGVMKEFTDVTKEQAQKSVYEFVNVLKEKGILVDE